MTSKSSWTKIFKIDISERMQIAFIMLVTGLLIYPFMAFYMIQTRLETSVLIAEKRQLAEEMIIYAGQNNPLLYFFTGICATVLGVTALKFLHSREQSDFYLSFPVRREEHYAGRFLGGIVLFAGLFLIVELILFGVLKGSHLSGTFLKTIITAYLAGMSYFILLYSITFLAMILTGKVLVGVLGTLVFYFFGSVVVLIKNALVALFCATYAQNAGAQGVAAFSPVLRFGKSIFGIHSGAADNNLYTPLLWALPVIGLGIILIRRRPGEGAQRALAFKIDSWINLLISVPLALAAGLIMESGQNTPERHVSEWIFIGAILFALLITWLMDFILSGSIKHILEKKRLLVISALSVVAVLTGFYYGGKRFDAYVPKESEMVSIRMENTALTPLVNSIDGMERETDTSDLYIPVTEKKYRIIKKLAENSKKENDIEVKIWVKRKDGKMFCRRYGVEEKKSDTLFEDVYQDEEELRKYFRVDAVMTEPVIIDRGIVGSQWKDIENKADQRKQILSAYRKDLENVKMTEEIQKPSIAAFYGNIDEYTRVSLPVTEDFKETIQVMKSLGMDPELKKDLTKIDYIELYNDSDDTAEIRDREKIKQILENAAPRGGEEFKNSVAGDAQSGMIQYKNGDVVDFIVR